MNLNAHVGGETLQLMKAKDVEASHLSRFWSKLEKIECENLSE